MINSNFHQWLASIFDQNESEVNELLDDKTAIQFLITWVLFENRCFKGYMQISDIEPRAKYFANIEKFDVLLIFKEIIYFHERYKDNVLYKNLYHDKPCKQIDEILKVSIDNLTEVESIVFATYVVYRFRNNIFHGNKGVNSWLNFKDQIDRCTKIMQQLISHAETIQRQLKVV
jgi:hypothetical protein